MLKLYKKLLKKMFFYINKIYKKIVKYKIYFS